MEAIGLKPLTLWEMYMFSQGLFMKSYLIKRSSDLQMENTGFEVRSYLDFEPVTDATSKLTMHMVFRSVEFRDKLMQMPFAFGLNMAHNRLEDFFVKRSKLIKIYFLESLFRLLKIWGLKNAYYKLIFFRNFIGIE